MHHPTHPPGHLLAQIAHLIDLACADQVLHTAVFVEPDPADHELVLGVRSFEAHPTDVLAGLVAPPSWWAFVLCTTGRAHFLDEPDHPPEPIVSTYARSRDGHEVSLLRRGARVTRLTGPAEGRIPDLVRAILTPRTSPVARDRAGAPP